MNENMKVYEDARSVPNEALKPIVGGRLQGMSDINPMWRIKKLTELFGICGIGWKVEIVDKRLEQGSGNEIVCFVDINLYVKVDGEWSAPIPGMGGSSFVTQERNGPFTSDECFKMAYTDAISVACKSLGFAADVYFANDRTKYSTKQDEPSGHTEHTDTDIPPQTLKVKYQLFFGSMDGFDKWTTDQQAAGKNFKTMEHWLQDELMKRDGSGSGRKTNLNAKSRVINLMNEMKWGWPTLAEFASECLGRKIGKVLNDIKSEDEWKKVEDAMLVTKAAM